MSRCAVLRPLMGLLLFPLLLTATADAATILYRSDAVLMTMASRVVRGRVISVGVERGPGGRLYTVTQLAVLEDFSGYSDPVITLREIGGTLGRESLVIGGAVTYQPGREVVVLLEALADGRYRSLAMGLSKFDVLTARDGDDVLVRSLAGTEVVSGAAALHTTLRLSDFRQLARAVIGRQSVLPEGTSQLEPMQPAVQPFTLLTYSNGLGARWRQADSGIAVRWYREASFPAPVTSGDGTSEILTALRAWTDAPGASLELQYAGTTIQSDLGGPWPGLGSAAGVIFFEDPADEIGDSVLALGGGFAMLDGSGGTVNGTTFNGFVSSFVIFQNAASVPPEFLQSVNFARVLQHEIGHGIGLGHSEQGPANIMHPSCCAAETPVPPALGPDDHAGLNFIYPVASAPPACTYSLSSMSASAPSSGGSYDLTVSTAPGCSWSASSNVSFVQIAAGANGTGSATLTYTVGRNVVPMARSGTLIVAGLTFTVNQDAATIRPALDLNGDGGLDLLWHHQTTGQISGWLMNGTSLADGTLLTPGQVADTNWKVVGAGDLDGDGQMDIVWQNIADGRVSAWLMNGLTLREGTLFSIPQVTDLGWKIRSVGDLDGDGMADIFWQHTGNGGVSVWLMNGLTVTSGTLLSPSTVADVNWKIVGTADFDGNGSRDLVWHHQTDGRISVWLMNGTSMIQGTLTSPGQVPDTNWKIRAVGDLNTDGHPDLIWQHSVDGQISAWLMNGLSVVEGILLSPSQVPDTNWHIVGPR